MPSKLKSETARRNGAKSHGPKSEEGKRTSAGNAVKHGIHSGDVVLRHEDPDAYDRLRTAVLTEWQPATPTEEALVLDMVNARWRLQRLEQLTSAAIEQYMTRALAHIDKFSGERAKDMSDAAICVEAHEWEKHRKTLDLFERWEGRLHRSFHRALKVLRSLQAERLATAKTVETQNERNEPTTEQLHSHESLSCRSEDRAPDPADVPGQPVPPGPPDHSPSGNTHVSP